jgi:SAM-dependent methyltransferase
LRRATVRGPARSWAEFWDRPNRIYVNRRHLKLHYARLAQDIAALLPGAEARVLDHGCGQALFADRIALHCSRLYLCDASPALRRRLRRHFAEVAAIEVLAPEGVAGLPDGSLDLVVACSLVQYLSPEELARLLRLWGLKLAPAGRLVVADVPEAGRGPSTDVAALLGLAWREGFLLAAGTGLAATFLSDYRRLRREPGLTAFSERQMLELLTAHGFTAQRRHPNLGFDQGRLCFIATRREPGS